MTWRSYTICTCSVSLHFQWHFVAWTMAFMVSKARDQIFDELISGKKSWAATSARSKATFSGPNMVKPSANFKVFVVSHDPRMQMLCEQSCPHVMIDYTSLLLGNMIGKLSTHHWPAFFFGCRRGAYRTTRCRSHMFHRPQPISLELSSRMSQNLYGDGSKPMKLLYDLGNKHPWISQFRVGSRAFDT